ncbi:MAG: 50S ribosomal protein L25/general stress protein Ctc [Bifidobacteriaceae bacterium]|jgi:large subunit ribosomal protein L25|nr:50S ribosomal protein L25/general stress protein Ctc [Bifidobacteriaceae bacterium]
MKTFKFKAEKRDQFGKGFARRARAEGKVPAVLYSKGADALHITLPSHEVALSLKYNNALYEIDVDGNNTLAVVKDAQRDAIGTVLEHVDFLSVNKGEKIRTTVNIQITGTVAPGLMHLQELQTVTIKADPTQLPEYVIGNVEGFEEGHNLFVRDLELPEGSELITDEGIPVAIVFEPKEEIVETLEEEAEGEEGAEESAAAEDGAKDSSDADAADSENKGQDN